jgi:hypothetical protein
MRELERDQDLAIRVRREHNRDPPYVGGVRLCETRHPG